MPTRRGVSKAMKHEPAFIWAIIHETGELRPQCDADGCLNRARALVFHCDTRKARPLCLVHAARGRDFNCRATRIAKELKSAS